MVRNNHPKLQLSVERYTLAAIRSNTADPQTCDAPSAQVPAAETFFDNWPSTSTSLFTPKTACAYSPLVYWILETPKFIGLPKKD
jgi:hypothetical protein